VDDASYVERMKRVLAAKAPADRLVFFIPEEKANYGRFVFALDGARTAGAHILGVITEPVTGVVTAPVPGAEGAPAPAPDGTAPPAGPAPAPSPAPAPEAPK
jgi:biopolymer transport protein TolR